MKSVLVTGGARSGKSSFAESIYNGKTDVVYIATSKVTDREMEERVKLHRKQRPKDWITYEGYHNIDDAVKGSRNYILDCLTVMTSNIMFEYTKDCQVITHLMQKEVEDSVVGEIERLMDRVRLIDGNIVMVTNEVGYGIVPDNHIARVFRDISGRVNRRVAAMCSEVYLVCCGIPVRIK
ncbi:MAG: bifunctional adenosylcobinamide kinase/adenosylcobinamide-phosphate guanylyltransferase [Clostridiales bacterium]|nr:bifunctional adenosylcobinamide kinase/adenosylcobinamide-phosphate guanylyltransferase [Clostridiales bacterium]